MLPVKADLAICIALSLVCLDSATVLVWLSINWISILVSLCQVLANTVTNSEFSWEITIGQYKGRTLRKPQNKIWCCFKSSITHYIVSQIRQMQYQRTGYKWTQLTLWNGCLMWGVRLVIPQKYREAVIRIFTCWTSSLKYNKDEILGTITCLPTWLPNIDKNIECHAGACTGCATTARDPVRVPLCTLTY